MTEVATGESEAPFSNHEMLKTEYQEAGNLVRAYTRFFIDITKGFLGSNILLFAGMNLLISGGRPEAIEPFSITLVFLGVVGMGIAGGAILIQRRTFGYWKYFIVRAGEIESELRPMQLYRNMNAVGPPTKKLRSANAMVLLYTMFLLFWLLVFLHSINILTLPL